MSHKLDTAKPAILAQDFLVGQAHRESAGVGGRTW
jgi:hypothetical protein